MRSPRGGTRCAALLFCAAAASAYGCHESPPEVEVDFSRRTPTTFAHHRRTPLRAIVALMAVPAEGSRQDFGTLVHKLAAALGRSAEVAFVRSARAAQGRLAAGEADVALLELAALDGARRRVVAVSQSEKGKRRRLAVVARQGVEADERARWRAVLLSLHERPATVATLARLSIARFVAAPSRRVAP